MPDPCSDVPAFERPSSVSIARARASLARCLGDEKVVGEADRLLVYGRDESSAGLFLPDLVVLAESAEDVRQVFEVARSERVPVTPRGLGTGKSGGALPIHGGIVLSMERMNRIEEISREDMLVVAGAGVVTGDLMAAVEREALFYPPDPNSLAMCSIGGNVACNAGGPRALKYGVTRHWVLAAEVVTPRGEVLELGKRTIKHATGYDLLGLIVGSEGTLGVITRVTSKLIPRPVSVQTALVAFSTLEAASHAVTRVFDVGIVPRTLELLDRGALDAVRTNAAGRFPEDAEALLILETDGASDERSFEDLERAATACTDAGATDVIVARGDAQRAAIWEPRRRLSSTLSSTAKRKISEDIAVPRSEIPRMLDRISRVSATHRVRVATYGHAGDGNLHVNILFDDEAESRATNAVREILCDAIALRGTISGEHGIGLTKRDFMPLEQCEAMLELQRSLKACFDPDGILNPGKIFPGRGVRE